jgi:hypothetical protein
MEQDASDKEQSSSGWCKAYDYNRDEYKHFAETSESHERLSRTARIKLRRVPCIASTNFSDARRRILDTFEANVEVIEIQQNFSSFPRGQH